MLIQHHYAAEGTRSRFRPGRALTLFARRLAIAAGAAVAFAAAFAAADGDVRDEPLRVHRTWMPDAYPSSFAVGFSNGLNFCFDPVRANVIYAWQGDYLDLDPTVNGKVPRDAVIRGSTFHRSLEFSGFRRAEGTTPPEIRFRAFRVRQNVPEFDYEVDGIRVRESVQRAAAGNGLIRQFTLSTADRALIYRPVPPARVNVQRGPARWQDDVLSIPAGASVTFTLELSSP